jgi:uncharacterized damage-inducible protein DinB
MIDITKLLKHMAWANQELIGQLTNFPDEALAAYATNPEWTVSRIIQHIIHSADWYKFRLTGEPAVNHDLPTMSSQLQEFARWTETVDSRLFTAAQEPEGMVERIVDGKVILRARSTILSQLVHHGIEHRAQLVSALEAKGFDSINLDDLDLWAYCDRFGE